MVLPNSSLFLIVNVKQVLRRDFLDIFRVILQQIISQERKSQWEEVKPFEPHIQHIFMFTIFQVSNSPYCEANLVENLMVF